MFVRLVHLEDTWLEIRRCTYIYIYIYLQCKKYSQKLDYTKTALYKRDHYNLVLYLCPLTRPKAACRSDEKRIFVIFIRRPMDSDIQ